MGFILSAPTLESNNSPQAIVVLNMSLGLHHGTFAHKTDAFKRAKNDLKKQKYMAKKEAKQLKIAVQESIRLVKLEKAKGNQINDGNDELSQTEQEQDELNDYQDENRCTHKHRRK